LALLSVPEPITKEWREGAPDAIFGTSLVLIESAATLAGAAFSFFGRPSPVISGHG